MLPSELPTDFDRVPALAQRASPQWLRALQKDLFNRLHKGEDVQVEAYHGALPALQANRAAWRELIEDEFQFRVDLGQQLTPEVFLQRFPEHADLLPRLKAYLAQKSAVSGAPTPLTLDTNHSGAHDEENPLESETLSTDLGGFEIEKLLGKGGMGLVFQAYDPRLKRDVALKVIRPRFLSHPTARARFEREACNMAAVVNDHVVTIHQSGQVGDFPFLVMELLRGEPLHVRLRRQQRLSWPQAVGIGLETAVGLEALHQCDVIHRDIKPSNIWLQDRSRDRTAHRSERVKILDFGLARTVERDQHLTVGFLGTAAYTAPEQAASQEGGKRTDLFSLGCVLYEMVTGQLAFAGPGQLAILEQVKNHHPRPVSELVPETPPALSQLIEQLLAKDPNLRPASAEEVYRRLSRLTEPAEPFPVPWVGDGVTDLDLDYLNKIWRTLEGWQRKGILALLGTNRICTHA